MKRLIPILVGILCVAPLTASGQPTCVTGELRSPIFFWGSTWVPGVVYWTLLEPPSCPCTGSAFFVDRILFSTFEQEICGNDVAVSMVGVLGDEACPRPDTSVTLSPVQIIHVGFHGPTRGDAVSHSIPISPMPLPRPAFLKFELLATSCPEGGNIGMVQPCVPCMTYWRFPAYTPTLGPPYPGCSALLQGNAVIGAGSSCGIVATARRTWGQLKQSYR